jgi:opacity protein-like surface antigen
MKATLIAGAALSLTTLSAFAADLAIPPSRSLPLPPAFTWTSCYGGLHAGAGVGQKDLNDTTLALFPTTGFSSANLNISGYMLGGQIGCDYQLAPSWVVGLEGAVSGGNIGGQNQFCDSRYPRRYFNLQGDHRLSDERNAPGRICLGSLDDLCQRRSGLGWRQI